MATIKSNLLTLETTLAATASYNFTLDAEHTNVISNYGLSYAVRYRVTPVPGDSQLSIEFWRGQKYFSGGTDKTRWRPAYVVLSGGNYSVANWQGRTITMQLDVASHFPNVRITNFVIDGVAQADFTHTPVVDSYSSVLTAYWVSEPIYVVMPDFSSSSPFEFPGAFSTGVLSGAANLAASFNQGCAATALKPSGAVLAASSQLTAAPGRTALGSAQLSSDFATETEYLDPTYFNQIYVGGYLTATMQLGGIAALNNPTLVTALADTVYSINVQADSEVELTAQGGRIVSALAEITAEFAQTALPGYLLSAQTDCETDTSSQFSGGMIRGFAADLSSDTDVQPTGNMIYDIGVQYAYDWVRVEDDYVTPYYYLGIQSDSQVWAQALLVKQADANIQASSTISGTGGYFQIMGSVLMGADCDLAMQQFVFGTSAGVIIASPEAQVASEFATDNITGLIFDIDDAIAAEFNSTFTGARLIVPDADNFASEFTLPDVYSEVVTGAQCWIDAETSLAATAGYFHPASAEVSAEFIWTLTPVRLIAIDEYYIDLVPSETRKLAQYAEPRIMLSVPETQIITVPSEPTTFSISAETRINKPELGAPYLVGRRTRRQVV